MDTGDRFRRRNLVECVRRSRSVFPDADIVVAEQGDGAWVTEQGLPCSHIAMGMSGAFRKTRLMNAAVRENPGYDGYVMVDADVLLTESVVQYVRDNYASASLVFPYGDCMYLNEPDTSRAVMSRPLLPGEKDHGISQARQTGLCNVFTRDTFDRVGGFDEDFVGWGAEDDAFLVKCRRLCGPILRNPDKGAAVYHMFHPKVNTREYVEHDAGYVANRVRCACIRRMSDDDLGQYVAGKATLAELVGRYSALGKLDIRIDWKYTGRYTIHMDATIYDIDRTGEMSMTRILDAMYMEDGTAATVAFIDDIFKKVGDLTPEQVEELNAARERYVAAFR